MRDYEQARIERDETAATLAAEVSALLARREVVLGADRRVRLQDALDAYHDAADRCAEAVSGRPCPMDARTPAHACPVCRFLHADALDLVAS